MAEVFTQSRWIELLRGEKVIYTYAELLRLTGLSSVALRRAVNRLIKLGFLIKMSKGFYANGFRTPSLEQIAGIVYPPSYVSCESALFMHGVADQAPHVLTCVTTNKTKSFRTGLGEIVYFHIKPELFFGYEARDRTFVAEPEKAALDFVYIQRQNGLQPALDEWNWEELSPDKLGVMGTVYPRAVREHIAKYAPKVKSLRQ